MSILNVVFLNISQAPVHHWKGRSWDTLAHLGQWEKWQQWAIGYSPCQVQESYESKIQYFVLRVLVFFCMEQQNWSDLWDNCSAAFQNSAVNFAPCAMFQWEDFRSTNGEHRTTIDDDWLIDVCPWTMSKFRAAEMSYHQDVTVQSQGVIYKIPSTQISYIYIYVCICLYECTFNKHGKILYFQKPNSRGWSLTYFSTLLFPEPRAATSQSILAWPSCRGKTRLLTARWDGEYGRLPYSLQKNIWVSMLRGHSREFNK